MTLSTAKQKSIYKTVLDQTPNTLPSIASSWIRNPSWLVLPSINSGDSKFIGLVSIYPDFDQSSNFLALSAASDYTVDWGDGIVENFSSGVSAYHTYNYNDNNLTDTNASVAFIDSGNVIQISGHGYTDGMSVKFYNIINTIGITEEQTYYVINSNTDTFQVTSGVGSAINLINDGSGNLLKYKQSIVTVIPQSGKDLTAINLNIKHNQSGLQAYTTPWLDIKLSSPNLTSLILHSFPTASIVNHYLLEQIEILNFGKITNCSNLFNNLLSLKNIVLSNTSTITNMQRMFTNCKSLQAINYFDTNSCTNTSFMFDNCSGLLSAPTLNSSQLNDISYMFSNCTNLTSPSIFNNAINTIVTTDGLFRNCVNLTSTSLFDARKVTNANFMFQNCKRLRSIPSYDFQNASGTIAMFSGCSMLKSVPTLNLSKAINMSAIFADCSSLTGISLNTMNVTNINNMFSNCKSLLSVQQLETRNVTSMISTFDNCGSLLIIPNINTSKVTNMSKAFYFCSSLFSIPELDTSNVTNMSNTFRACDKLSSLPVFNTSKATNMNSAFYFCASLTSIPNIDTKACLNLGFLFSFCRNLIYVPDLDGSSTSNTDFIFAGCSLDSATNIKNLNNISSSTALFQSSRKLNYIPAINLSGVTQFAWSSMFEFCPSLAYIDASGGRFSHSLSGAKLSKSALNKYINNIGYGASQTLTINNNWGNASFPKTITSVYNSNVVTCTNTSFLSSGMSMTGTGTSINGVVVVSDVTNNTITLTNNGLVSGTRLSFSSVGTTTAVRINTIYYPVNITTNTFQLASTSGGSAIDLTGSNSNMTLRYTSFISEVTPSSIILDLPACSSITSGTWTFRTIDPYTALHQGWSISY